MGIVLWKFIQMEDHWITMKHLFGIACIQLNGGDTDFMILYGIMDKYNVTIQMTQNKVSSEEILELVACEDFNENISDEAVDTSMEPNRETLLMCILHKLQNQKGKTDWSNVTTTQLYVDKLATAQSIAEKFLTKELHLISSAISEFTNKKIYSTKVPTNIQKLTLYPDYLETAQSGFQVLYIRKCDKLNPYIK